MKIVLALDSYKNCLSSFAAAEILAKGIAQEAPDCLIEKIVLADGGEGTVEAVACSVSGAELDMMELPGPLGEPHLASFALLDHGRRACVELANVCGIELMGKLDVMRASTLGLGVLVRHLAGEGIRDIVMGIGGSASCDGGIGFLQGLGGQFFDSEGKILADGAGGGDLLRVASCDFRAIPNDLQLTIACDVTNPLLGELGAAKVFGPQKGATPEMVAELEKGLTHFSEILRQAPGVSQQFAPGDGAAGGIGYVLRGVLGGVMRSGGAMILDLAGFDEKAKGADWVITGEGCSDFQTVHGKLCSVVAERAKKAGAKVILLSGAIRDSETLHQTFDGVFSIAAGPGTLDAAIRDTGANLYSFGRSFGKLFR